MLAADPTFHAVIAYAHGTCPGDSGHGGWAYHMEHEEAFRLKARGEADTTSKRMELRAVIEAIKSMKTDAPIQFRLPSTYVIDGATRWLSGWAANGWKGSGSRPILNADLWRELWTAKGSRTLYWAPVRVHAHDRVIDLVDSRAREVAEACRRLEFEQDWGTNF